MKQCYYENCLKPVLARDLCAGHYNQERNGIELKPLRFRKKARKRNLSSSTRNSEGLKRCSTCLIWLSEKEFDSHPKSSDKLKSRCKICHLVHYYSITRVEFEKIVEKQNYKCPICGEPLDSSIWSVDHDHKCCPTSARSCGKCIKGILCRPCNVGLGMFQDNIEFLENAVHYERRYSEARDLFKEIKQNARPR